MGIVNREWISSIWRAVETGRTIDWADVGWYLIDWADFEWYALDRHNSIGMLTSAGPGPVPRSVFREMGAYIGVVEFSSQLPRKGGAEIIVQHAGRVDDWREAAERGLYGLDFQRGDQGPYGYRMIARPKDLLRVEELPEWVREWLDGVRLERAVFADTVTRSLDLSGSGLGWL